MLGHAAGALGASGAPFGEAETMAMAGPGAMAMGGFLSQGVPPVIIHLNDFHGIFRAINHPAVGVPHVWKSKNYGEHAIIT